MNDYMTHRYEIRYGLGSSENNDRTACRQFPPYAQQYLPWNNQPGFNLGQQYQQSNSQPDYNLVQRATADFNIKNSFTTLIPAVVMLILFGSNCDIIGRRPVMLLPYLGKVVRDAMLLVIISLDLSDGWLLAVHALEASFGSNGLIMLSAFAYITDFTSDLARTRALLLTEVVTIIARIVPMVSMSFLLRRFLYNVSAGIGLGLSVLGVLYTLFVQPESMDSV